MRPESSYSERWDGENRICTAVLVLDGKPKATNELLGHSRFVKHRNAIRWKSRVMAELVRLRCVQDVPVTKAKLTLCRYSNRSLDYDGLVASFKPVVDGLCARRHKSGILKGEIQFGAILAHDGWSVTGPWTVTQKSAPKGETFIVVEVEWSAQFASVTSIDRKKVE